MSTAPAPIVTERHLNLSSDSLALPEEMARLPDYAFELYSHPADLRVTILNYGERQPGAETVYLQLSRPVAGRWRFCTTNGEAAFSASGAYLLLHNLFLLIAIDAHTLQAWHYVAPPRTLFLGVGWSGEVVTGKILAYGKRSDEAAHFGPWSWAEITRRWQPGVGGHWGTGY